MSITKEHDTTGIRQAANRFLQASWDMQQKAQRIDSAASSAVNGTAGWNGEAAQAFTELSDHLGEDSRTLSKAFERVAKALQLLALRLEHVNELRRQVRQLRSELNSLHDDLRREDDDRRRQSIRNRISQLNYNCESLERQANELEKTAHDVASAEFDAIGYSVNSLFSSNEIAATSQGTSVLDRVGHFFSDAWDKVTDTAEETWAEIEAGWHSFADFSEGFTSRAIYNVTSGTYDPMYEEFPEARSRSYQIGRVAGDVFSAVVGGMEMVAGGTMTAAGAAEAGVSLGGVVTAGFSTVGVAVAVAGVAVSAHGAEVSGQSLRSLGEDWQLFSTKSYPVKLRNGHLAGQTHEKSGVPFDENGFPIFESKYEIQLEPNDYMKSRTQHRVLLNKKLANEAKMNPELMKRLGLTDRDLKMMMEEGTNPPGFVWHHHQKQGRMQLVDKDLHSAAGHTGGYDIWGQGSMKRRQTK